MKKLLFLLSLCVFIPSTWAFTLAGTITDIITGEPIKKVNITLDGKAQDPSEDEGYIIPNFNPGNGAILIFKHSEHEDFVGEIINSDGLVSGIKVKKFGKWGGSQPFELKMIDKDGKQVWDEETLMLDIEMFPEKKPIITGQVTNEEGKGIHRVRVRSTSPSLHSYSYEAHTNPDGFYEIEGYKKKKYHLKFNDSSYKDPDPLEVEVEDSLVPDQDIELIQISVAKDNENIMVGASGGFECDELMPKYLIGANCIDNNNLKGDASDITMWIQKFGGKITGLIGMIAVVLIIWNAFNITTAAGDSEKISQGKKGLIWTIVGLGLTMFAYVIVKTVIMLTYTQ